MDAKKKILIIDDEAPTLSMLRLLLDAMGYSVLIAENETTGIEIFKKEKPHIILTDIKMPGKDGFSVLQQVKQIAPETQVIVVTGHGDRDLEKQAFAYKATDFLHKPLDPNALETSLKKAEEALKHQNG